MTLFRLYQCLNCPLLSLPSSAYVSFLSLSFSSSLSSLSAFFPLLSLSYPLLQLCLYFQQVVQLKAEIRQQVRNQVLMVRQILHERLNNVNANQSI